MIKEHNWSIWFQILHLTLHSISKHLLSHYFVLGMVLTTKDSAVNKTDRLVMDMDNNQIIAEINANIQLDEC